jgi:hypothetical protein
MQEKHLESMRKAIKNIQIADHMAYVTYPVVKDKRLLLKILENIYQSILNTINAILQHDYLWKKINLYHDPKTNFRVFSEKCAPRYQLTKQEISEILDILALVEKHKRAPLEFARRDKVIIMSDNLRTTILDIEKIKTYLRASKNLIEKANSGISHKK